MVLQQEQEHQQSQGSNVKSSGTAGSSANGSSFQNQNDTTYTKIFVGGLAWETKRETMKQHFEQFGEILEAVVIIDKNTGRSKGYGFVTFKDADAASKACADPAPVIDGRRANCNLASLGATRSRPSPPAPPHGSRFRSGPHFQGISQGGFPAYSSSIAFTPHGPYPYQQAYPYSPYGFPAYPPEINFAQGYYNPYAAPQFPQMYAGPAAPMYPHAQGAARFACSSYMQAPPVLHYSSPGLVAATAPSSQYGVTSLPKASHTSGVPLTGGNAVSLNQSPGQTSKQYAMPLSHQQYAAVAAAPEQAAS